MWRLPLLSLALELAQSVLARDAEYSYLPLSMSDTLNGPPAKSLTREQGVTQFETTNHHSSIGFKDELARYELDFQYLCEAADVQDPDGKIWKHFYLKAVCDVRSGNPRQIKLTCSAYYKYHDERSKRYRGDDKQHYPECSLGTVCQAVFIPQDNGAPPKEEAGCVDEADLVKETLTSKASTSASQKVHCGLSLSLPGHDYAVAPGQKAIDLVLTEQVTYPDGTPYPAPLLFIRDKSDPYHMPRSQRQHASVTSLAVELGTYRGHFVQKQFEFCMQMLPGHFGSSVIFTYSYFQTRLHHGRVPATSQPRLEKAA